LRAHGDSTSSARVFREADDESLARFWA
jgi:hypothetical protein